MSLSTAPRKQKLLGGPSALPRLPPHRGQEDNRVTSCRWIPSDEGTSRGRGPDTALEAQGQEGHVFSALDPHPGLGIFHSFVPEDGLRHPSSTEPPPRP